MSLPCPRCGSRRILVLVHVTGGDWLQCEACGHRWQNGT